MPRRAACAKPTTSPRRRGAVEPTPTKIRRGVDELTGWRLCSASLSAAATWPSALLRGCTTGQERETAPAAERATDAERQQRPVGHDDQALGVRERYPQVLERRE